MTYFDSVLELNNFVLGLLFGQFIIGQLTFKSLYKRKKETSSLNKKYQKSYKSITKRLLQNKSQTEIWKTFILKQKKSKYCF